MTQQIAAFVIVGIAMAIIFFRSNLARLIFGRKSEDTEIKLCDGREFRISSDASREEWAELGEKINETLKDEDKV